VLAQQMAARGQLEQMRQGRSRPAQGGDDGGQYL
jgi:hypothetical protein